MRRTSLLLTRHLARHLPRHLPPVLRRRSRGERSSALLLSPSLRPLSSPSRLPLSSPSRLPLQSSSRLLSRASSTWRRSSGSCRSGSPDPDKALVPQSNILYSTKSPNLALKAPFKRAPSRWQLLQGQSARSN